MIYVTGDTHGDFSRLFTKENTERLDNKITPNGPDRGLLIHLHHCPKNTVHRLPAGPGILSCEDVRNGALT